MVAYNQNLDFVASMKVDAANLEAVDFNASPVEAEVAADAGACLGTLGTLGSAGGTFGSFGTWGCGL